MVCRHLGQVDPNLSPLAIQVVNDKGRCRSLRAPGKRHRDLCLYGRPLGEWPRWRLGTRVKVAVDKSPCTEKCGIANHKLRTGGVTPHGHY